MLAEGYTVTDSSLPARPASYDKKVALVLQGGGALGSYQAGVYEALASSEYVPDWVAGISIGAVNAAIIAGNAPENRVVQLRRFWEDVTSRRQIWPPALGPLSRSSNARPPPPDSKSCPSAGSSNKPSPGSAAFAAWRATSSATPEPSPPS